MQVVFRKGVDEPMSELLDERTVAQQENNERALSAREQLALTILADEWTRTELKMCFETSKPIEYKTPLSEQTVREIARFESERVSDATD